MTAKFTTTWRGADWHSGRRRPPPSDAPLPSLCFLLFKTALPHSPRPHSISVISALRDFSSHCLSAFSHHPLPPAHSRDGSAIRGFFFFIRGPAWLSVVHFPTPLISVSGGKASVFIRVHPWLHFPLPNRPQPSVKSVPSGIFFPVPLRPLPLQNWTLEVECWILDFFLWKILMYEYCPVGFRYKGQRLSGQWRRGRRIPLCCPTRPQPRRAGGGL